MDYIIPFYQYVIYFYATLIIIIYLTLAVLGYFSILGNKMRYTAKERNMLLNHPEIAPGISIIAPAYNEEVIVIDSTNTLLNLDYPNFEIIIVNDGSKDKTLELLINEFDLVEVPFAYMSKVNCEPVKRIFKSTNAMYERLTVVDKVNGGTKADAMNAGVNVAKYDYFINTDVDCILAKHTLSDIILPVMDSEIPVIAVGATMRMANGCDVENGEMTKIRPPSTMIPIFQETEYLRSYLVAKMGWSALNAIPNISGGFGLFDRSIVIAAGGFDPQSHAEDMDMTLRMVAYMYDNNLPYKMKQIPQTCCWTEGPSTLKVLGRQRTRWGRGLLQLFFVHHKFLFNRKYGRMGWLIMPYALLFELLAPVIETIGFFMILYLWLTDQINYETLWLMVMYVYLIGISISLITITFDFTLKKLYSSFGEYLKLILFSSMEAFVYHPFIVFFSLKGYWQFLTGKNLKWGEMTRKGFSKKTKNVPLSKTA